LGLAIFGRELEHGSKLFGVTKAAQRAGATDVAASRICPQASKPGKSAVKPMVSGRNWRRGMVPARNRRRSGTRSVVSTAAQTHCVIALRGGQNAAQRHRRLRRITLYYKVRRKRSNPR
jgi:hypothetical protein